ncbi:MAG TPA: DUF1553 domain-containing protein, partial [Gemmataceae bacterium]|nr:DUF1553 domain-containing protein [Gemmataceae bacterium]
ARRYVTTQAPQALALLNGKVALGQARAFAGRVLREAGPGPAKIIERAYRLALSRSPDTDEREATLAFLNKEAALHRTRTTSKEAQESPLSAPADIDPALRAAVVDLCHALFNLNEFVYID